MRLLPGLAAHGIAARLILGRREGALLDHVPDDIPVIDLGGRRASASIKALSGHLRGRDAVLSGTNARNVAVLAAVRLLAPRVRPAVLISEHTSAAEYLAAAKMARVRRWLMRALYPGAARLVVPMHALGAGWTASLGARAPEVAELPNAIFPDRDPDGAWPARDPDLVLAMGRLHPAKGHDRVLAAFAAARDARPALRLEIWGEGADRPDLERLIARHGLAGHARLCGLSDTPLSTLARAGALVMGSRREGFGNVAVEALSVGTPVIATDCEGPNAILSRAPVAGRIVPNHDAPDDLARAMVEVTGAPAAIAAAREAAPALRARFGTDGAARALADLVRDVTPV